MVGEADFLKGLFSRYYRKNWISAPSGIEFREFGFVLFDVEGMVRHLSFKSEHELNMFLRSKAPLHSYFSSAYYRFPGAEDMDAKEWIGADLVFDIDADHIPTPCKDEHDRWVCLDCGYSSTGMAPESCLKCGSKRVKAETWLCEQCLEVAKSEAFKLIDEFLVSDFGFSHDEISINFSGHRGYHVHVRSDVVRELSQDARRELTDYIKGIGFSPQVHGLAGKLLMENPPDLADPGWRGRVARGLYDFVYKADVEDYRRLSIRGSVARKLVENKNLILRGLERTPPLWPSIKGVSSKTWLKIIRYVVEIQAVHIDERVTTDIKRLMRLPGSLHGKTGFRVKALTYSELEKFDPLSDAVAFTKGEVKVYVERCPEIFICGQAYGPYRSAEVELPISVAVYLICKGAARLVDEE